MRSEWRTTAPDPAPARLSAADPRSVRPSRYSKDEEVGALMATDVMQRADVRMIQRGDLRYGKRGSARRPGDAGTIDARRLTRSRSRIASSLRSRAMSQDSDGSDRRPNSRNRARNSSRRSGGCAALADATSSAAHIASRRASSCGRCIRRPRSSRRSCSEEWMPMTSSPKRQTGGD